ncbi:hypothetical protein SAMN05660337_1218 [Maridesulfovibrio ferrireducens]|uniref:Uncharacterized protein n=1 Tax=Maridesulfovibrio ferrireducens TaxID=246191 RepID=A0A1G9EQ76_9BACT|nr:hypothetical protein [Maridesulfovibrio ferrireducens]SDK78289.1 hypothetical protein SAMN05660337_1218 [Maridesulfovibrio ferrireducens]
MIKGVKYNITNDQAVITITRNLISKEQSELIAILNSKKFSTIKINSTVPSATLSAADILYSLLSTKKIEKYEFTISNSKEAVPFLYYSDFYKNHLTQKQSNGKIYINKKIVNHEYIYSVIEKTGVYSCYKRNSLYLGHEYRDKDWAEYFENAISIIDNNTQITINLAKCTWTDPHPFLSLILKVKEWTHKNKEITIVLPDCHTQFAAYITQEGFLQQLISHPSERKNKTKDKNNCPIDIKSYTNSARKNKDKLSFHNQTCIPVEIILLPFNTQEITDRLISEAKNRGLEKCLASNSKTPYLANSQFIVQEFRQALAELLDNVKDHAYPQKYGTPNYGAVYARLRYGIIESPNQDINRLKNLYKKELQAKVGFQKGEIEQTGFLEVFVSDTGRAFCESLKKKNNSDCGRKNIFLQYFKKITKDKQNSARAGSPSKRGLSYIATMLGYRCGEIRIFSDGLFAGLNFNNLTSETGISTANYFPPKGAHITLRISKWKSHGTPINLNSKTWKIEKLDKENIGNSLIMKAYHANSLKEIQLPPDTPPLEEINILCIDDLAEGITESSDFEPNYTVSCDTPHRVIMWRPKKNISRRELLSRSVYLTQKYNCSNLLIADQDLSHSLMTLTVFESIKKESIGNIKNLVILSSNYCHIELNLSDIKNSCTLEINKKRNCLLKNLPELTIAHIVNALKRFDTHLLMLETATKNTSKEHIQNYWVGPVKWSSVDQKDTELKRYIDFNATLNNRICQWVYRRSLSRFLAYCSTNSRPHPTDHYIDKLVHNYSFYNNDTINNSNPENSDLKIILSSIVITGGTVNNRIMSNQKNKRNILSCVFFKSDNPREISHPDEGPYYLLCWSQDRTDYLIKTRDDEPYYRVIDSPAISPIGNKEWCLARAISPTQQSETTNSCCENQPHKNKFNYAYGNSPETPQGVGPRQVYRYWQTNGYLKFGHWQSGGHHDCIGVNVLDAVQMDSVQQVGHSWEYIESHLDRVFSNKDCKKFSKCDMLVCLSGEISQFVLKQIHRRKQFRDFELTNNLLNETRIATLSTIQGHRSATRLRINPMDLKEFTDKVDLISTSKGGKQVNILLFMPVITSIRSYLELTEAINSSSEKLIKSISSFSLLDRSRMPNSQSQESKSEPRHVQHSRLWRLDIDCLAPDSGSSEYSEDCPLCNAYEYFTTLLSVVDNIKVKKQIKKWISHVEPRRINGINAYQDHYISKEPLSWNKELRLFLKKPKDNNFKKYTEKIKIITPVGLAAILTELITISGDYTLPDKRIAEIRKEMINHETNSPEYANLVDTIIITLVTILMYLRLDMKNNRKIHLLKNLLTALHQAYRPSRATAFAVALLSTLDSYISTELVYYLSERPNNFSKSTEQTDDHSENRNYTGTLILKESSNVDFHLGVSIIIKRSNKDKVFSKDIPGVMPRLYSLLNLTAKHSSTYIDNLRILFEEIGYRVGIMHKSYLQTLLESEITSIPPHAAIILQKIIATMENIKKMPTDLPHTFDAVFFKNILESIRKCVEDNNSEECFNIIYENNGNSLFKKLKDYFCFNYFAFETFILSSTNKSFSEKLNNNEINSTPKSTKNDKCPVSKQPTIVIKNRDSAQEITKVQGLMTKNTESLINEFICNARRHYKNNSLTDEHKINIFVQLLEIPKSTMGKFVAIEITNTYIHNEKVKKEYIATVHHLKFEEQGGKVIIPEQPIADLYTVKIILPTLNSIQRG